VHVLEAGRDLLALDGLRAAPRAGRFEAWGESPGASRGDTSWAWLTKDFRPYLGEDGSGAPTALLERPALRTAAAARTAARAAAAAAQRRTLRARATILGRPQVRLGDAVRLRGTPDALDGLFRVRGVRHRLTKRSGFTTAIELEGEAR
jgi:phage protein D